MKCDWSISLHLTISSFKGHLSNSKHRLHYASSEAELVLNTRFNSLPFTALQGVYVARSRSHHAPSLNLLPNPTFCACNAIFVAAGATLPLTPTIFPFGLIAPPLAFT